MDWNEIKEMLEKQLQLLSERSHDKDDDLPVLTQAMCEVVRLLVDP